MELVEDKSKVRPSLLRVVTVRIQLRRCSEVSCEEDEAVGSDYL